MTDLDPEIMAIFTKEECLNATEATKVSVYFCSQKFFKESIENELKYIKMKNILLILKLCLFKTEKM